MPFFPGSRGLAAGLTLNALVVPSPGFVLIPGPVLWGMPCRHFCMTCGKGVFGYSMSFALTGRPEGVLGLFLAFPGVLGAQRGSEKAGVGVATVVMAVRSPFDYWVWS